MVESSLGFQEVLHHFGSQIQQHLPYLLFAFILLLAGLVISWLLRWLTVHVVRRVVRTRRITQAMADPELTELAPKTVGTIVFWGALFIFIAAAAQALGIAVIQDGLSRLAVFLPNLLAAIFVLMTGVLLGKLAKTTLQGLARSARLSQAGVLGESARVLILTAAGVIALAQIGIDSTVLVLAFGLIVGGTVGGLALAFGFGARTSVSNLIAARSVERNFRAGSMIRIGEIEGRILEISSGIVVLETKEGRAFVPARLFEEATTQVFEGRR